MDRGASHSSRNVDVHRRVPFHEVPTPVGSVGLSALLLPSCPEQVFAIQLLRLGVGYLYQPEIDTGGGVGGNGRGEDRDHIVHGRDAESKLSQRRGWWVGGCQSKPQASRQRNYANTEGRVTRVH
jgi:hypothetical protein